MIKKNYTNDFMSHILQDAGFLKWVKDYVDPMTADESELYKFYGHYMDSSAGRVRAPRKAPAKKVAPKKATGNATSTHKGEAAPDAKKFTREINPLSKDKKNPNKIQTR